MLNQSSATFNQSVGYVHGGMELLGGQVDFDDLAFLQMVLFMQQTDADLSAQMKEIRETMKQKESINNQISYLNTYLSHSDSDADDLKHKVYLPGGKNGLDKTINPNKSDYPTKEEQKEFEDGANNPLKKTTTWSSRQFNTKYVYSDEQREFFKDNSATREEIQNKIEDLKRRLEELNSSNAVKMVELQSIMNKREQAVQFTSNVLAKSHETAKSVIANLK